MGGFYTCANHMRQNAVLSGTSQHASFLSSDLHQLYRCLAGAGPRRPIVDGKGLWRGKGKYLPVPLPPQYVVLPDPSNVIMLTFGAHAHYGRKERQD